MGKRIFKWVSKVIKKVFSFLGLSIQRKTSKDKKTKLNKKAYVWSTVSILPQVRTIIDIGVGPKGTYGLYEHFPQAHYIFIDPLEECRKAVEKYLDNGRNIFINTAVGAHNTSILINIARRPARSSVYKRQHSYLSEGVNTREVPMHRLDDICTSLTLEDPCGLKIDTEGYELEVLKGARETLEHMLFVIVEFHLKDAQKNGYTLQDIINYMNNDGFAAHFMLRDGRNIVFLRKQQPDEPPEPTLEI